MSATVYYIMHVLAIVFLTATTFQAFANPDPATRKKTLITGGILSLLVLTGGFGLLARLYNGWPVWVFVKVGCWIALSAAAGMAYRSPSQAKLWKLITVAVICTAVFMVYEQPF